MVPRWRPGYAEGMRRSGSARLLLCGLLCGCAASPRPASPAASTAQGTAKAPPVPQGEAGAEPAAAPAGPRAAPGPELQWFDDSVDALGPLLAQKPQVIAFGEYHQLKKTAGVRSALRRFIDDMLPHLLYWPTDLVVETWFPAEGCETAQAVTREVRKTTQRPKKTEDEIVTLIRRSREIGIQPHILEVACGDYKALLDPAGEIDYEKLLTLLTRLIRGKVDEVRRLREGSVRPVLVYGGALHNDLYPKAEYKAFTFGPELSRELGGAYLEVDLLVPEYVEKDPDVTGEAWWARYQRELQPKRTALVRRAAGSYAILFPRVR